jgi:6-pyruvoyltetrahydropterin/6-carboxytetrahydropterin synthase
VTKEESYQVRVEGIRFDAAHFATFHGRCEPLHGHSYQVAAEVDGTLSQDSWVVDFIALKRLLRSLCEELDHRFLLQRESETIQIDRSGTEWTVHAPGGAGYVFPANDVVALPLDNTTAERLAQWFCERVHKSLKKRGMRRVEAITIEVWEGPGQRASYRMQSLPLA